MSAGSNISCSFRARYLWSCTQLTVRSNVSFSFHLSFSVSFPKLTIFAILCLYLACKMRKITALTWETSSWRLVEKFHISAFPMYSLYNWIGEHEITKLKKNIFASNPEKRTQKQIQKDMNYMEWHKMDYLIFSAMRMRHLICTIPYENNKDSTRGVSLETSVFARARAQLSKMLYISTHLSVPHGENN